MQSNPFGPATGAPARTTLMLLCAFSVLPLSLFLPSLPAIARDLRADYALVGLAIGGYAALAASLELLMGPLSDRVAHRYPLATTILYGRIVACAGPLIALALQVGGATHAAAWFGPCVLVGLGNGFTNPGAHAGALSVRPELSGSASGLAGAMTIAGGAALSSLTSAVVTPRNAAYAPLAMMLLSAAAALLAACCVRSFDARDAAGADAIAAE